MIVRLTSASSKCIRNQFEVQASKYSGKRVCGGYFQFHLITCLVNKIYFSIKFCVSIVKQSLNKVYFDFDLLCALPNLLEIFTSIVEYYFQQVLKHSLSNICDF